MRDIKQARGGYVAAAVKVANKVDADVVVCGVVERSSVRRGTIETTLILIKTIAVSSEQKVAIEVREMDFDPIREPEAAGRAIGEELIWRIPDTLAECSRTLRVEVNCDKKDIRKIRAAAAKLRADNVEHIGWKSVDLTGMRGTYTFKATVSYLGMGPQKLYRRLKELTGLSLIVEKKDKYSLILSVAGESG